MTPSPEMVARWPRNKADQIRKIIERISICGCGSDAHWECILELLCEAEQHKDKGFYRDKWFEFGAKVLDSWELLEHGTGIGWAWLTDDGKLLLEFLREFGTEDHDMNDDSGHPIWSIEHSWGDPGEADDWYGQWAKP